jgi:hypothetical protein
VTDGFKPMLQRDIVTRLHNWGACQRGKPGGSMVARETRRSSPYGGQGYKCMTDVVCTMLRDAANGPKGGNRSASRLDFDDSRTIQAAWAKLTIRNQTLLKHHYVLERTWYVICRELDIKHWPPRHFDRELQVARDEIEQRLKIVAAKI